MKDTSKKELIVFDLDETLSESKCPIDQEMAFHLGLLIKKKKVAVISGGLWQQLKLQVVDPLEKAENTLSNLFMFPTCGASFYRFEKTEWNPVYKKLFAESEKEKIMNAFSLALDTAHFTIPEKMYGELIEDRETQITFSAFGQQAPIETKKGWDPDSKKREVIISILKEYIPEFEIHSGGATSIDVTHKGIDKAFGIRQMEKYLFVPKENILFIGDKFFPGGNDYPVKELGVECIEVSGPEETKRVIQSLL